MIHRYIDFVKANGYFDRKRNEQSKYWMYETINERLKNDFYHNSNIEKLLPILEKEVLSAKKSSFIGAKEALEAYYGENKK
jgi:LAO/AO transport system kinase